FGGYREAGGQGGGPFFSPSPGSSSLSSWSFFSDASDEAALYAACDERRYSSSGTPSSASPALSRRGSLGEEGPEPPPPPPLPLVRDPGSPGPFDYAGAPPAESIPQKTRRTSSEQAVALPRSEEPAPCNGKLPSGVEEAGAPPGGPRKEVAGMDYLAVPSPLAWSKARIGGHSPIFRTSALPPLDWPLPSQYEQLELRIEVQPRAHHRAHYETEGSRGAVKAAPGGHPIVKLLGYSEKPLTLQMFIGTADERNLRPHAFYQVHRITGKMVATASYEAVVSGTKVLEMTLLPENNMAANIDCAGILKLRNSDIELRKGETDIGRKNTRVRLVFRVHVPQGSGKVISVQTASVPIECCEQRSPVASLCLWLTSCLCVCLPISSAESQRSAQELPQVEAYSPNGKLQWEEEATVNRSQSNEVTLTLTIPEYSNKRVSRPVQVYFYVSNGRRKRSPTQSFKFLPVIFKEEPLPDASLRGFPSASGPHFGSDMDFSPPRPPYPSYPHEDPAYETPYLSEGFSYGTPPLYPQTGPPPSYRPGPRMFPETGGTTAPFRPPLPSSPPLEGPFTPQSSVHPPPAEGYNEVGPSYGPGEGAPEQEKSRGGYGSGFRDSVPIQGITLEE
ncbi:hypothetical protein E2I00_017493, partial [Balaenoptera physalus]